MPGAIENPPGYRIEGKLGEGGFACVYKATHLRTKRPCALKSVDISTLSKRQRDIAIHQWLVEVGALLKVSAHPNVVGYRKAFDTGWQLWVEMELCVAGDLGHYFEGWSSRISRTVKRKIMLDTSAAVSYLHDKGIVHRDIKAENVLISYTGGHETDIIAKLTDFGLAKVIASVNLEGDLETYYMDSNCGTRYYLAPEVLQKKYTLKADIFSMAVLFVAIVSETRIGDYMTGYIKDNTGKCWPFGEYMLTTKLDIALRANFGAGDNLRNLVNSMLKFDYHKRPSAKEIHKTLSTTVLAEEFPKDPCNRAGKLGRLILKNDLVQERPLPRVPAPIGRNLPKIVTLPQK